MGGEAGETTGVYRLVLTRLGSAEPQDPYVDVEFRCGAELVRSVAVLEFEGGGEAEGEVSLTVWASSPVVLRVGDGQTTDGETTCLRSAPIDLEDPSAGVRGMAVPFPAGARAVPDALTLGHVVRFSLPAADIAGQVGLTLASPDPEVEAFVGRLEGLGLERAEDVDVLAVRHAPNTRSVPIRLIVVGASARLDPLLRLDGDDPGVVVCPDWGLRPCGLDGWLGADMVYNGEAVRLDRLSAAAQVQTDDIAPVSFGIAAGNPTVTGAYVVWVLGGMSKETP